MTKDKSKRLSDWEKKFTNEVKIETSQEFFHETDEGININPLYTQEDLLDTPLMILILYQVNGLILVDQKHPCIRIDHGQ